MKKITFVYIVIILVVLMVIQIIIFNLINKKENNVINSNKDTSTSDDLTTYKIYPINTFEVFDVYKGPIKLSDFEGIIYQMIYANIPWINNRNSKMSVKEIGDYYSQNTKWINAMYIYSSDDLYLIAQQINNVYKDIVPMFDYVKIDEKSIKDENGYCSFDIYIYFSNNQTISLKMYLTDEQPANNNVATNIVNTADSANNNASTNMVNSNATIDTANKIVDLSSYHKPIIIEDNSGVQKLYKVTNEGFNRANALEIIESIIDKAEQIKKDTAGYSINKEKQYYDLHKEDLNELGIYSSDDFVEFIGSVKKISWNDQDKITGYSIDTSSLITGTDYTTADLYINYGNIERIALKISVSNKINIVPQIRIK